MVVWQLISNAIFISIFLKMDKYDVIVYDECGVFVAYECDVNDDRQTPIMRSFPYVNYLYLTQNWCFVEIDEEHFYIPDDEYYLEYF
jgi:hypothetical protein